MTDVPRSTDMLAKRLATLPWWRRPRTMRRTLAATFALVVLVSVLLVAGLNFFAARELLLDGTRDQLVGVAEARTRSIEEGATRILANTTATSSDLAVGAALDELVDAFEDLDDEELTEDQEAELEQFYADEVVAPLRTLDVDVSLADVVPASPAARYLQFHYVLVDPEERSAIDDAGDGSEYSSVHARVHPYLSAVAEALAVDDLLLVSDGGDVVYSVDKQIDLGTSLIEGPYDESVLAVAITEELPRARSGTSVISDVGRYIPGGAQPVLFTASAVRNGTELLGGLVLEIPIDGLNAITTADQRWTEVGLEDGETYLVGTDSVLRSESRAWIEDPEGYLDRVDDEVLARRIETLGSPVSLQPVETEPVAVALDGDEFTGDTDNYLGQRTFSYARAIDVAGVDWIVVADVPLDDARQPLLTYLVRVGIALAILLPSAAVIGVFMATRLTRPVAPVLRAAEAIAAGERDPELPDFGRNEFGDLGDRLTEAAHRLAQQETDLEEQYEKSRTLLLAALPPRVVSDDDRSTTGTGQAVDHATAVAVAIDVRSEDLQADDRLGRIFAAVSREAEQLAATRGLERVRAAADRHLFVAGLGVDDPGADEALDFAGALHERVTRVAADEGVVIALRIGLSTGLIETGLLRLGNLSFTAWGQPVRNAMVIGTLADVEVIGVDRSTADAATDGRWRLDARPPVHDPDDRPIDVFAPVTQLDDERSGEPVG